MGQGNTLDREEPKLNLQVRQDVERLYRKGKIAKYSVCAHISLGRHTCVHACTCAWTRICVKA